MNAEFFGLAFLAALNPKLLGLDVLLIQNTRPRLMFSGFLLGCMTVCLSIGLLDVFVLRSDAIKTQGQASAGLDLALGVPLVVIGALLATGRLHRRRRAPAPAADGQLPKRAGWEQRLVSKPRFGIAVLLGAVAGTPGARRTGARSRSRVPAWPSRTAPGCAATAGLALCSRRAAAVWAV
jgi:Sap, sulfolipid-1-addressing protein